MFPASVFADTSSSTYGWPERSTRLRSMTAKLLNVSSLTRR
jgi:hypothetical protein